MTRGMVRHAPGVIRTAPVAVPPRARLALLIALLLALVATGCESTPTSLPFDPPSRDQLNSSRHLVFAYYHPEYIISHYNAPTEASDFYTTEYNTPTGFNSQYLAYGSYMRDRPIFRKPLSGDFQQQDMATEVQRARNAGIDGFIVDGFDLASVNYQTARLKKLIAAAQGYPDFKIVLLTDFCCTVVPSASTLAQRIHDLSTSSVVYRLPDTKRLVVVPFRPEQQGTTYWRDVSNSLAALEGAQPALVPEFLDLSAANQWAPLVYGFGTWGGRSPKWGSSPDPYATDAQQVHGLGKVWMQAVSTQDVRPTSQLYWEANNTENLRYTWLAAIKAADWVFIPTWNDYGEGTEMAPSKIAGWTWLDIGSYYLYRFKLGTYPAIKRDALYVTNRVQFHDAQPQPASGNTKLMQVNLAPGQSVLPRDTVEVVSMLTSPQQITVNVGTKSYPYDAPAGVYAKTLPLGIGTVSATASGGATVTSPGKVVATPPVQNLQYYGAGSLR